MKHVLKKFGPKQYRLIKLDWLQKIVQINRNFFVFSGRSNLREAHHSWDSIARIWWDIADDGSCKWRDWSEARQDYFDISSRANIQFTHPISRRKNWSILTNNVIWKSYWIENMTIIILKNLYLTFYGISLIGTIEFSDYKKKIIKRREHSISAKSFIVLESLRILESKMWNLWYEMSGWTYCLVVDNWWAFISHNTWFR